MQLLLAVFFMIVLALSNGAFAYLVGPVVTNGVKSFDLTNGHLFAIDSTWQDN